MYRSVPGIPGLSYIPNYLQEDEERALVESIDQGDWNAEIERRTQHFGCRYPYKGGAKRKLIYLGPLPPWAAELAQRLHHDGHAPWVPNQAIVNEYEPGQGIASHTDRDDFDD